MTAAVQVREPLGARTAQLPLQLGGAGADLVLPGIERLAATLEGVAGRWQLRPGPAASLTLNGMALREPAMLDEGDVVALGSAQLLMHPVSQTIDVLHLAGNDTVAPLQRESLPGDEIVAGVREVFATDDPQSGGPQAPSPKAVRSGTARRALIAGVLLLLLAAGWILLRLVPVSLQITPVDATVEVAGLLDLRAGERIFLLPGKRTLTITRAGYSPQRIALNVSRELADAAAMPVTLALLPGRLQVNTNVPVAQLLIDGRSVANVPGEIRLAAGAHALIVRAPRHVDFVSRVQIAGAGRLQRLDAMLQPATGWLVLDTAPARARIAIDGMDQGTAPLRLELDAGLRQLSIAAPGRRDWRSQIAVIAGQTLDLGRIDLALPAPRTLQSTATVEAAPAADAGAPTPAPKAAPVAPAARLQAAVVGTLILMPAGHYLQGSDRREQGRRSNEVQRDVTLTRPFYLAEHEVTNGQFRQFRPAHASGVALDRSIDLDSQAVSNVSWSDAVEFCNWLSLRDSLPAAYERRDGRWQFVQPLNSGYRLPTEAEWEYAARFVNGERWLRYAWGDGLPPPAGAANLAGQESLPTKPGPEVRLASALPGYRDDHPVVAPVGSYARSAAGFHDLGGNVSEWMHDVYASLPASGATTDPLGVAGDGAHAIRGASWRTAAIAELRLAWRDRAIDPAPTIGFRVARSVEAAP
jgi:formylglycine-generating enzyme required for sulfatase activity